MAWNPEIPYNDIPTLPVVTHDIETKAILKKVTSARTALAQLNQSAKQMPNQPVLINTLPLLEAQSSSEIENIVTTKDSLFQFSDNYNSADPATKEALRYRTALFQGYENINERPLTANTAMKICSIIKDQDMGVRKLPGTVLANNRTGETIYTPPEGEAVIRELLSNWEKFIHSDIDLDPLIKLAISHYQFEAIHPFSDGNGRSGRVINSLFLLQEKLIDLPILYLSRYIIEHKDDYYRLLLSVTKDHNWEEWILFMLGAVEDTSNWTLEKINAIDKLMLHTKKYIKAQMPKQYSYELLEILFNQPYCRIQNLIDAEIAQRQTASNYLQELCKIGVLQEINMGRDKLFLHPKLLRLLTQESNDFPLYF
ncbi:protein adenylyltransferase Fic [Hydrogenovibrio thermophilus]|uniref:Protein adenylyltransferase n=1 Tax=Hydrogenovibrio thermophilus TaxID=265883 RepID=A0A451G4M4_9GAMM|nr:Fic family protein [Hydrogenovibrio thermophilus]QAB14428.1 Fic family protein [Hydrogenovibrio thermophilus]